MYGFWDWKSAVLQIYDKSVNVELQMLSLCSCRPDRQLQDIVYKMVPFLEECKYSMNTVRCILHDSCTLCVILFLNPNVNSLFCTTVEGRQMCNFYKERGLEVPKPGTMVQPLKV